MTSGYGLRGEAMVRLLEQEIQGEGRKSSKGNQLKWEKNGIWYKADYAGYEGLTEYVVSRLLTFSNLEKEEYVVYQTEEMQYKQNRYTGCRSKNFLPEGWKLITLERLFQSMYGKSLHQSVYSIRDYEERVRFFVEQTIDITGLQEFGGYLSKLLTLDAFFLNEDRHTHNIAVLLDEAGRYHYCPIFDNGAALLSDTTLDYPLTGKIESMIPEAEAKTICTNFDEQLDAVENLYGRPVCFQFGDRDVEQLLADEPYYPGEIKRRVQRIIRRQKNKYQYLFA